MELYTRTDSDNLDIEVLTKDYILYDILVPEGFEFDGASTPRILWSLLPPFKRVKKAACIHDYLCSKAKNSDERAKADKIFMQALHDTAKISWIRIKIAYCGVRIGSAFGSGVRYPHWTDNFKE